MHSPWNLAAKLLLAASLLAVQPILASASSAKVEDDVIRPLADRTARQLALHEFDAVYASMSPKLKQAYSRDALVKPGSFMQKAFGRIQSYEFEATTHGKRGVGSEWIRIVTYWYHARTEKYPGKTYLKVEVTQEQGRYYIAGYAMERVLSGGRLPFLKQ